MLEDYYQKAYDRFKRQSNYSIDIKNENRMMITVSQNAIMVNLVTKLV